MRPARHAAADPDSPPRAGFEISAQPSALSSCRGKERDALPKGTALLLSTGARPALIRTLPWYTGPRAGAINAAIGRAVAGIAAAPPAEEESRR